MRVKLLYDFGNLDGTIGGAELTMQEFAAATPEGVEHVELEDADTVVVGNCVTFPESLRGRLSGKKVYRYFNDVDAHSKPALRRWFLKNATCIFISERQVAHFPDAPKDYHLIPPPVDLERFRPPLNTKREGTVSVATWQGPGKGAAEVEKFAREHGPVIAFGTGSFYPAGPNVEFRGPVPYAQLPELLWQFETFVFLPTTLEPFGRVVAEAHAAGCDVWTNRNVGAMEWLGTPGLRNAASDFWDLVQNA